MLILLSPIWLLILFTLPDEGSRFSYRKLVLEKYLISVCYTMNPDNDASIFKNDLVFIDYTMTVQLIDAVKTTNNLQFKQSQKRILKKRKFNYFRLQWVWTCDRCDTDTKLLKTEL